MTQIYPRWPAWCDTIAKTGAAEVSSEKSSVAIPERSTSIEEVTTHWTHAVL